jgi:tetratricopeptide (TPR) repeat protein
LKKAYIRYYRSAIISGNYLEAKNILKSWISVLSDDSSAYVYMGNYMMKYLNKMDEALKFFNKALKIDSDNVSAIIGIGDIFFFKGNSAKALSKYKEAFKIDNKNSRVLFSIANGYAMEKKFKKAEKFFKMAIKQDPTNSLAYLGLGKIMAKRQENKEAEKYFKIAIDIDENLAYAKYELAKLYSKDRPKLALELFQEALELDSGTPEIIRDYGSLLMKLKIYSKASKVYELYLKLKPDDPDVLANLGGAYLALGLVGIGKETIEKALELDSENGIANYNMALIYEQGAEYDLALNHYRLAFKSNYESRATILNISNIYMKEKKYSEAIEYLQTGLKKFKDDPYLTYNLGLCFYLKGDNSKARSILDNLSKTLPKDMLRLKKVK